MFNYNVQENLLEVFKVPYLKRSTVYEQDDMYVSYQKYLSKTLKEDIETILIPAMNKVLHPQGTDQFPLSLQSYRYVLEEAQFSKEYSIFVQLSAAGVPRAEFCLLRLPYMDEFGVIERCTRTGAKTKYAMTRELVQADDITLNGDQLKIITKGGCYINYKKTKSAPDMKFRDKSLSSIDVLAALADKEGLDKIELIQKLVSVKAARYFKDEKTMRRQMLFGRKESFSKLAQDGTDIDDENLGIEKVDVRSAYISALESEAYSLEEVRDAINTILSIDRALGESLSRPITLPNGRHFPSGTVVTESVLRELKYHKVNELTVFKVPNMIGYCLATNVNLPALRRGSEIVDAIRDFFPDEGSYLAHDYIASQHPEDEPITIPAGTRVSDGLLEMLQFNGYTEVYLKETPDSKSFVKVPLEVSIVSNRNFEAAALGIVADTKWVYVDEEGNVLPPSNKLMAYDQLALMSLYDRLEVGECMNIISSADEGLRKKVNLANESIHKAFMKVAPKFVRIIRNKLLPIKNGDLTMLDDEADMEFLFFGLSKDIWRVMYKDFRILSRPEMANPVAFYSSFSKVKSIVKDKQAIADDQHNISMGHYGKLCPYETPVGKTLGLVNNKAIGCKIENGVMKTCYHPVRAGIGNTRCILFDRIVWLGVKDEEKETLADVASLEYVMETNKKTGERYGRITTKGNVLARTPNKCALEKVSIDNVDVNRITYVSVDPNQTNSHTASTIPFQGSNDATRVTFGLSMCKQAKGLLNPEVPLVMTSGFIDIPRLSTYFMLQAEYDGIVESVSGSHVTVDYPGVGVKDYTFAATEHSHDGIIIREVLVEEGQHVKAGDIMMSSNYTREGYLATGSNCLVAYIPKGANYEDGVFGSERLSQKLMSFGVKEEVQPIPKDYQNVSMTVANKFRYLMPGQVTYRINASVTKRNEGKKSTSVGKEVRSRMRDQIVIRSRKIKGFTVDQSMDLDSYTHKAKSITLTTISLDALDQGDKVANRHGNKGVVPAIRPNSWMPQFANGEFVDVVYNPMGVASRMNVGQIREANIGLAAYVLRIRVRTDSFNGATMDDVRLLLSYAWHLANNDNMEAVFNAPKFRDLPAELHQHCRENIHYIRTWKNSFNEDGTATLFNPKTGCYFEQPVVVGINYVYKLVHESAKKAHARGGFCTEPYVPKTAMPPKGLKYSGGQRWGYMELEALAAYGAVNFIHELQNERGDNPIRRNNLTVSALHTGDNFLMDEKYAIRRSTEAFTAKMRCLGVSIDFEGELPKDNAFSYLARDTYTKKTLILASNTDDENAGQDQTLEQYSQALGNL